MMVILSKREYDDLVKKATAAECLAEEKAEAMKAKIKSDLIAACQRGRHSPHFDVIGRLLEILAHY